METSIFLARFWGMFIALESLVYFVRWQVMSERMTERYFVTLDGYLTFTLGIATIVSHNIWILDWRVAVTIWGWLMLLRGLSRLGFPDTIAKFIPTFSKNIIFVRLSLFGAFAFGIWLVCVSG